MLLAFFTSHQHGSNLARKIHKKGSFLIQVIVLLYGYGHNRSTMNLEETTVSRKDNHSKVPLASIFGKRVNIAFDGGILTSDSGVLLLREVAAKSGILSRIIAAITDRRHPSYVAHSVSELVKQRVFQIACGYEDANDCDALRSDPGFKAACDRLPISGEHLGSQPTMSRFEN